MKIKILTISIVVPLLLFTIPGVGHAATVYTLPQEALFAGGETFNVDIKINSEGADINAVEAAVNWPGDILNLVAVSIDDSVFDFWVKEPVVSGGQQAINFIGGTANGVSGESLHVVRLRFETIGIGIAEVSVSDVSVTAADGRGTNILREVSGGSYRVGIEVIPSDITVPSAPVTSEPVRVEREAVLASELPSKPEISIPLYPDSTVWHNYLGAFVAQWDVFDDVVQMAVSLDQSPNTIPDSVEEALFTGKKFRSLEDGVWYVHTQFKNNVGWGPTAHYRIAIDTEPPLQFETVVTEGEVTDNPSPTLQFETSDALSGLSAYQVKVDDGEGIHIDIDDFTGTFTLPLMPPGVHTVTIKALDYAGNSVVDSFDIEILPLPSPVITFVTAELFTGEEQGLTVKGSGLPNTTTLLILHKESEVIAQESVSSDENGVWSFTFSEPLRRGDYAVSVRTQDSRGALSLSVESSEIRVKDRPIIQIGFIQLGKGGAALLLLVLLIAGFGGGILFFKRKQQKLLLRVGFTEMELATLSRILTKDVETLAEAHKTPTKTDDEYALTHLEKTVEKMIRYLNRAVEKIKK